MVFDLLKSQNKLGETLSIHEDQNVNGIVLELCHNLFKNHRKNFSSKTRLKKLFLHTKKSLTRYDEEKVSEILSELFLNYLPASIVNRHYASTIMNHASSRSHTIFRLYVKSIPSHVKPGEDSLFTESVLNFVDLAGSEKLDIHDGLRAKKRENSLNGSNFSMAATALNNTLKDRTKESQHINKSLFFLTQVISLKAMGKR